MSFENHKKYFKIWFMLPKMKLIWWRIGITDGPYVAENIMWLLKLSCDTNTNFTWWSCDYEIIEMREERGRIGQPAEFIAKVTRVNLLIRFLKKYILFWNDWIKVWLSWRSIFGQNYVFSGQKLFWTKMNILNFLSLKKFKVAFPIKHRVVLKLWSQK